MALNPCQRPGPVTPADLKAEVYEPLLKSKAKQLLWAFDRLKEADQILALLGDAVSLDELRTVQVHAMAWQERSKQPPGN